MKVTLSESGATVDAHDLGPLLGLAASEVPAKMRAGEITSQSEEGVDADAGLIRLTFWYADQRVRLICDAGGTVIKTTRIKAARVPDSTAARPNERERYVNLDTTVSEK